MTSENKDPLTRFIVGGISGCVAKTVVAPLDRVKILMQGQRVDFHNLGPLKILLKVYKIEGIYGLFQGNFAQLVRVFPYSATQFFAFGLYNDIFANFNIDTTLKLEKFISGSLAGITACTLTYPLDLVRARIAFQQKIFPRRIHLLINREKISFDSTFSGPNLEIEPNQPETKRHSNFRKGTYNYSGIIHAIKSIIKESGFKGLYKGFTPTIIGMGPYAGSSFYTFETLKAALNHNENGWLTKLNKTNKNRSLSVYGNLLCGTIAGLVAQTISYPLDVVRRVMQLNVNKGPYHRSDGRRRTWFSVMRIIFLKYGVRHGLFRGMTINYIRVVPVVAVSFTIYETFSKNH